MSEPLTSDDLATKALAQIRESLLTLSFAADGWYEDEAQVALDALDWLEQYVSPGTTLT